VFFPAQIHSVEEDVGELFIPVHRSGDISEELMVVCYTQQGIYLPFLTSLNKLILSVAHLHINLLFSLITLNGECVLLNSK